MNTEKTPLVQKLILGVLTLILVCLVVMLAQNRSKPAVSVSEASTMAEPAPPPPSIEEAEAPQQIQPKENRTSPRTVPPPAPPPAVPAVAAASPVVVPPPVTLPPPHTTLVNPVGREPVIVVRPHGAALETELCGRVRLEGAPPPEVPISMDARCSRLQEGPVTTRHYVVGPEGGLANVLVYVKEGLPSHYSPPLLNAPTVTVTRCFFEPYVLGVQAGQTITFSNADNLLHNFHGIAKANAEFNFSLATRGAKRRRTLDHPEIFVRLKCDVHPWEFAHVAVIPHPFFSVTDTNGVFCLPAGLPHGRYVLAAVHPKAGETLREIVVREDNANVIELAFTIPRRQ